MRTIASPAAFSKACAAAREAGKTVGFVPTMGALHAGHAALIERARKENRFTAVSIFVNPKQFGPREDLSRYPRPFAADAALCRRLGVDALFHPDPDGMYPADFSTSVRVAGVSEPLEGERRPGHFEGVATVVLKLLLLAGPDRAYFGEKDWQQLQVVRRMSEDLGAPWTIVGCPTVRERDGLALSSRNRYLSAEERALAPALQKSLREAAAAAKRGASIAQAEAAGRRVLEGVKGLSIDYFVLVDADTLLPPAPGTRRLRGLAAARLGSTRLIDNLGVSC